MQITKDVYKRIITVARAHRCIFGVRITSRIQICFHDETPTGTDAYIKNDKLCDGYDVNVPIFNDQFPFQSFRAGTHDTRN